jgi:hypothetical protein
MKKIIITFILSFLLWVGQSLLQGGFLFAQAVTMLPDGFIVPNLATAPGCTVADKGKMYYNTTTNLIMGCDGTQWKPGVSQWNNGAGSSLNYTNGNVGINTTTPQYALDVNGTGRVNTLLANALSIGTTTATIGITVADGDIAIKSTVDNKVWKFDYSDANNYLTLQEDGVARMVFANGGNVGIGATSPTAKLSVDGTGSFTGNLTVNGGKGIVRTTSATSLKTHITQVNLGALFTVNANGCATSNPVSITSAGFTAAPTTQVGNLVSGTGDYGRLVVNAQSVSSTSFIVRLCNNSSTNISLNSVVFNIMCIGN